MTFFTSIGAGPVPLLAVLCATAAWGQSSAFCGDAVADSEWEEVIAAGGSQFEMEEHMKSILTSIAASSLFAALAIAQPPRYTVTDLGPLPGGTFSIATIITNGGLATGFASPPDHTWHAVLWQNGRVTDIGTPGLGGKNSVPYGLNERGEAAGYAETHTPDPNGEDFCGFKANGLPSLDHTCLAFVWQDGVMTPLPTLGGPNGAGSQINNRGEVAGFAENTTRAPACPAPQVFQFKPVIWENGKVHELPTFPGDPDGAALGINDRGQVVGASGSCTAFNGSQTYLLASHALLWQNGRATDLGNLGGKGQFQGHFGASVNNRGWVVGWSDLRGDTATHAFLWTKKTLMQDLGVFPGDVLSFAAGINDAGKVVGTSVADETFTTQRAVLWENGVLFDLNNLIIAGANSGLYLGYASAINARGEIVGWGLTSGGDTHAFLAIPFHGAGVGESLSPGALVVRSEDALKLPQRQLRFGRFGGRLMGPR